MSYALPSPPPPRAAALALIVGLHLAVIGVWLTARWVVTLPVDRVGTLVWVPLAPTPEPPSQSVPRRAAAAPAAPPRPAVAPTAAVAEPTLTVVAEPAITAPPPPASGPRPRLLDSEASRRAIREAGSQPLLAERAADATGIAIVSKDQRYDEAAAKAGKGDCLKGEFAGSGMGLLSLPALALAAAKGDCAK
ncbi:MAG: hypothetical protein LCH73_08555 [Proteobacteria bacterium]|nr:hypothetical protein [Pseudomonadota bacterium]